MSLTHILVFVLAAFFTGWLLPARWRAWALMGGSLLAIYWLQPSTPIRHLDFWLPTASIALTVFVWTITRPADHNDGHSALVGALVILGIVLILGFTRYTGRLCCLTPSPPPGVFQITLVLGPVAILAALSYRFSPKARFIPSFTIIFILIIFAILKAAPLSKTASAWLRAGAGQSTELASALDIPWLGFSYLAFRLLHVLRDHQSGKSPDYSLAEFVTYAIFFPTYTAGPIDRSQRFLSDLRHPIRTNTSNQDIPNPSNVAKRTPTPKLDTDKLWQGGQRILVGIFKKYALADSLALIALNAQNAPQVTSSVWMWVLLYAYALRIYFDFSGYTDIAIGLGRLMGFKLPENFDHPYLKQNLTTFWNSWHITLAQWFRAYFFNPFTRALRTHPRKMPVWSVILLGQTSTMLLIGLWHGFTWNFAAWGLWHGLGLFIHNRWSAWSRTRIAALETHPRIKVLLSLGGWFLTFQYVVLGWVWFALPDLQLARGVLLKLVNILFLLIHTLPHTD